MKPIKLSTWKIKLPMYPPGEVSDDSTNSEYSRCPRRGLYRYGLRRGFTGTNFPIQFGLAYHKYREVIEELMVEEECDLTDEIHDEAQTLALTGFIQPPAEHKHSHNDMARAVVSMQMARERVTREREQGKILVTKSEDSFDLELPFWICTDCSHTFFKPKLHGKAEVCPKCGKLTIFRARHGGRVDQFIRLVSLVNGEFTRDFKTTGQMGAYYDMKFEPNSQMQGYTFVGNVTINK